MQKTYYYVGVERWMVTPQELYVEMQNYLWVLMVWLVHVVTGRLATNEVDSQITSSPTSNNSVIHFE